MLLHIFYPSLPQFIPSSVSQYCFLFFVRRDFPCTIPCISLLYIYMTLYIYINPAKDSVRINFIFCSSKSTLFSQSLVLGMQTKQTNNNNNKNFWHLKVFGYFYKTLISTLIFPHTHKLNSNLKVKVEQDLFVLDCSPRTVVMIQSW